MAEDRLADIESRQAFQDDLLQKLDDALGYQQRRILELEDRVARLLVRLQALEQQLGDIQSPQDEGPPPHY